MHRKDPVGNGHRHKPHVYITALKLPFFLIDLIAKELQELQVVEEEERNLEYFKDRGELIEW